MMRSHVVLVLDQLGGARLPNGARILTKPRASSNPASGYTNKLAEPRFGVWQFEARGPTARHAHRSSGALRFTNVSTSVKIVRPCGSLALPKQSRTTTSTSTIGADPT